MGSRRAKGTKTIEIKTIITTGEESDSLATVKPQTTLKLLKEIEQLRMSDLVLDDDDEDVQCSAPGFDVNEKLYNNLVGLDVNMPCPTKGKRVSRPAVKRDESPKATEFLSFTSMPEYSFRRVFTEDLPEVKHPTDNHFIYKLRKKWQ